MWGSLNAVPECSPEPLDCWFTGVYWCLLLVYWCLPAVIVQASLGNRMDKSKKTVNS